MAEDKRPMKRHEKCRVSCGVQTTRIRTISYGEERARSARNTPRRAGRRTAACTFGRICHAVRANRATFDPPEKLLRAQLLQILYTIRSEPLLIESAHHPALRRDAVRTARRRRIRTPACIPSHPHRWRHRSSSAVQLTRAKSATTSSVSAGTMWWAAVNDAFPPDVRGAFYQAIERRRDSAVRRRVDDGGVTRDTVSEQASHSRL
jgi:hypothetical protein